LTDKIGIPTSVNRNKHDKGKAETNQPTTLSTYQLTNKANCHKYIFGKTIDTVSAFTIFDLNTSNNTYD
jgi:hypothetical protein